ncbi:hypothetical protein HPB51_026699 [Rhipicephalus microplus]|uniref:Uncharacterized protein n=1 Tax=Rhipicephalus microplus TaxID=6941 RepID=A0A9J6D2X2_RHIMP|nr:hypothetical protein HPB51_026699 [Rhipicephalus microplus]
MSWNEFRRQLFKAFAREDRKETAELPTKARVECHTGVQSTAPLGRRTQTHVGSALRIAARPYGIKGFRKPLKELGIILDVRGIGMYQMPHVWLLNMKTDEAKKTLLVAGLLSVKGRPCFVIVPERQEVCLMLRWVAFDVDAETVRRAFREYN